jgi:3-phenylpropionate/trans-cinnamate dioxygenase ferredoxin subunit
MSDRFVRVARTDEIPEGEARVFEVGDVSIAVCNVDGRFHAIENTCTHDDGPLGEGILDGPVIECPRHGARFDVRTGAVLRMPAVAPVRSFTTKVEGSEVFVAMEDFDS